MEKINEYKTKPNHTYILRGYPNDIIFCWKRVLVQVDDAVVVKCCKAIMFCSTVFVQ